MLKIIARITFFVISILSLIIMMPACSQPASSTLPEPSYAKAITENIIKAVSNGDFTLYSKDLDPTMKQAMSQQSFDQVKNTLASKVGSYVPGSLEFNQAAIQNQYTVVIYSAKFTNEPDNVLVTISFMIVNGNNQVAGLYFNSPRLRN